MIWRMIWNGGAHFSRDPKIEYLCLGWSVNDRAKEFLRDRCAIAIALHWQTCIFPFTHPVFSFTFRFSMVAYCSHTRRLAVGSRLGHIALYELRSSRCQLIPAHDGPISALAFSPEGKVLASFSFKDKRISFYQVRIALFIDVKYKDILISRFRDRSKKKTRN